MDLVHRGLGGVANRVLNRYLDRTLEDDGIAAVPLFLSLRAGIRAHVTATALEQRPDAAGLRAEALAYLDLAERALDPAPARLVAIGGVSGSGKSTLAAALAPDFSPCPGARLLRSDVTRKLLCGVAPETRAAGERLPARNQPARLRRIAAEGGDCRSPPAIRRSSTRCICARRNARHSPIWRAGPACRFPGCGSRPAPAAMAERIRTRRHDASDATAAVMARQLEQDPGPIDWTRLEAGGGAQATLSAARRALARDGR